MQHLHTANTLEDMHEIAKEIASNLPQYRIVLLKGELGAGKTTLAQNICQILGINESITSPTYTIVNEYEVPNGSKIYHFDLYRLKKTEELQGFGFLEYIDSGNPCLIEWPAIAEKYLTDQPLLEVTIHKTTEGREIEMIFNTQNA